MSRITLLTTTFYDDPRTLRLDLVAQLVGNAVASGHGAIVLDASPIGGVESGLRSIGASVFRQSSRGMGPGRRELFNIAGENLFLQSEIFLWTEEKPDLVRHIPEIAEPILRGDLDVVVVGRTDAAWTYWPEFQLKSEQLANRVYAEATGRSYDPMHGPVAFCREMLHFFQDCTPWEWGAPDTYIQHAAPIIAMAQGARVGEVRVDNFYPIAQRREEEAREGEMRAKRGAQLAQCSQIYRSTAEHVGLTK